MKGILRIDSVGIAGDEYKNLEAVALDFRLKVPLSPTMNYNNNH